MPHGYARTIPDASISKLERISNTKREPVKYIAVLKFPNVLYKEAAENLWADIQKQNPSLFRFDAFIGYPVIPGIQEYPLIAIPSDHYYRNEAANEHAVNICAKLQAKKENCQIIELAREDFFPQTMQKDYTVYQQISGNNVQPEEPQNYIVVEQSTVNDLESYLLSIDGAGGDAPQSKPNVHVSNNEYSDYLSNMPEDLTPTQAAAKAALTSLKSQHMSAIQKIGKGLNAEDGGAATREALSMLASHSLQAMMAASFDEYLKYNKSDTEEDESLRKQFYKAFQQAAVDSLKDVGLSVVSNFSSGTEADLSVLENARYIAMKNIVEASKVLAQDSSYAALNNLEIEFGIGTDNKPEYSVLTVIPLHESKGLNHSVFTQMSHEREGERRTYNAGLAYRYMPPSSDYILGLNTFLDYQNPNNHWRASVGADFQTSLLSLYTNYYKGLSGWQSSGYELEERAMDGFDFEIGGRLPQLPAMEFFAKAYVWDQIGESDIFGQEVEMEYSPVPAVTISAYANDETDQDTDYGLRLRLNHKFGTPWTYMLDWNEQFKHKNLADYRFNKVRRTNEIRLQERDLSTPPLNPTFLSIIGAATIGVNAAAVDDVIELGQNVTVSNGSFVVVRLSDGSILNVSAAGALDMVFNITENTITLVSGDSFLQFISVTGAIDTIVVPGGTIALFGTDLDVLTDGVSSTVRVRDGAVGLRPTGSNTQTTVNATEIASIGGGIATVLANNDPDAITHAQGSFTQLDANNPLPVTPNKAAPFITKAPQLTNAPEEIGEVVQVTYTFSRAVTVTGAPQMVGEIGGVERNFVLVSGSGTNQLRFEYTLQAADSGATSVIAESINLNGGTINTQNLAAVLDFTSTTLTFDGGAIPGVNPSVIALTAPSDGSYAVGETLDWLLRFDQPVTVSSGTPSIDLTLTSGSVSAVYETNTASDTLRFRYTIQMSDQDLDGVSLANTITLNGATIRNVDARDALIDFSAVNVATPNVVIDNGAPTIISISPADNATDVLVGSDIEITFSEDIFVDSGTITITDTTAGTDTRIIPITDSQVTISGDTLTINPTSDFDGEKIYDVELTAGIVEDAAGNNFAGLVSPDMTFTTEDIDAPIVSVVSAPADTTYPITDVLRWDIQYNETVNVAGGTPHIDLELTSGAVEATYVGLIGGDTLRFEYIVQNGDEDLNGVELADVITLNGATIQDTSGNDAVLTFTDPKPSPNGIIVDADITTYTVRFCQSGNTSSSLTINGVSNILRCNNSNIIDTIVPVGSNRTYAWSVSSNRANDGISILSGSADSVNASGQTNGFITITNIQSDVTVNFSITD